MATTKRTVTTSKNKKTGKAAAVKAAKKPAAKKIEKSRKNAPAPAVKRTAAAAAKKAPAKAVAAKPAIKSRPAKPEPVRQNTAKPKKKLSVREEQLYKIKMHLVRQRNALLNGAELALNELPGQTIFPDLGDQATAETDRNFMLRLRGREQRLLKKIDEAIERIDCGTFGICDDCGNEIDIKRLEVRPVTTMCIECKTLQEEEEKLRES